MLINNLQEIIFSTIWNDVVNKMIKLLLQMVNIRENILSNKFMFLFYFADVYNNQTTC